LFRFSFEGATVNVVHRLLHTKAGSGGQFAVRFFLAEGILQFPVKHAILVPELGNPFPLCAEWIEFELEFVSIQKPPKGGLVGFTIETALPSEDDLCVRK
jgi:hypothetical protein